MTRDAWRPIHSGEAPLALCSSTSRGTLGARSTSPAREARGARGPGSSFWAHHSRLPLLALWTMHRARSQWGLSGHGCLTQGYRQFTDCPVQAWAIIHGKEILERVRAGHQATQLFWVSSRQAQHHHLKPNSLGLSDRAGYVTSQWLIHQQNHHPWHLLTAPRSIRCQEVSVSYDHSRAQIVPTWVRIGDATDLL